MRAELHRPREAQEQVQRNHGVVQVGQPKDEPLAQTPRVRRRRQGRAPQQLPALGWREQRQVPVLGHVPVEGVERVDRHGDEPRAVQRCRNRAARRLGAALQVARDEHGKRRRVLDGVGEVLAAPAGGLAVGRAAHAQVFNHALSQADEARHGHEQRHDDGAAAVPVGVVGRGAARGEEHAGGDEEVAKDLGVRGQDISEENVAKFAVLGLGDAAEADTTQGGEEAAAAGAGEVLQRDEEEGDEGDEVGHGDPVVLDDAGGHAPGEEPEERDGDTKQRGKDGGKAVGREVVGYMVRRGSARVSNQRGHVDATELEAMEVEAPAPDSCGSDSVRTMRSIGKNRYWSSLPRVTMKPTR